MEKSKKKITKQHEECEFMAAVYGLPFTGVLSTSE